MIPFFNILLFSFVFSCPTDHPTDFGYAHNFFGYAVAQLVETSPSNLESRGFDSRWCNWNFSLTSIRPHYGPGVNSASNRNEYQEYFLGQRWPVLRSDNLPTFMCRLSWNLGTSTSWSPLDLSRAVTGLLYIYICITFVTLFQPNPACWTKFPYPISQQFNTII